MLNAQIIQKLIFQGNYLLTKHADKERKNDRISIELIENALSYCEVIENYPEDPRGESCLVLGYGGGRPIHVVCAQKIETNDLLVITVYDPSHQAEKWMEDYRKRK